MMTTYEWDVELVDEHGDILDHDFLERLPAELSLGPMQRLALVRDRIGDGITESDRQWCYVTFNGTAHVLPEYFEDAGEVTTNVRVPKRLRAEFDRCQITIAK